VAAPLAEQVRGGAAHDEVDLELDMPVRARADLPGRMPDHAPVAAAAEAQIVEHRKER
jgi:hypothetical protein